MAIESLPSLMVVGVRYTAEQGPPPIALLPSDMCFINLYHVEKDVDFHATGFQLVKLPK